jgi:dGTP triphosphohydrolase
MFGIKKLQAQVKELKNDIQYIKKETDRTQNINLEYFKIMLDQLAHQKLDLSKINTRFHDLGEKHEKSHENLVKIGSFLIEQNQLNKDIRDKIVTDDAVLQHIKELNQKMTFLFDYMKQLEKLLSNVELIVDKCLPEMTIKLPKKKKTS